MTKHIILRSYDPETAKLYGKDITSVDWFIMRRSRLVHTEIQFSDRYGGISFSATRQDGCKCARFKMIGYSHPERWRNVYIEVTKEQEAKIFAKCCEMADLPIDHQFVTMFTRYPEACRNECYFGPNALKYDLPAVMFGFISKARIWKGAKKKVFCTEACAIALMMEVWPELLKFGESYRIDEGELEGFYVDDDVVRLNPDQLSPIMLDSICRLKFDNR